MDEWGWRCRKGGGHWAFPGPVFALRSDFRGEMGLPHKVLPAEWSWAASVELRREKREYRRMRNILVEDAYL